MSNHSAGKCCKWSRKFTEPVEWSPVLLLIKSCHFQDRSVPGATVHTCSSYKHLSSLLHLHLLLCWNLTISCKLIVPKIWLICLFILMFTLTGIVSVTFCNGEMLHAKQILWVRNPVNIISRVLLMYILCAVVVSRKLTRWHGGIVHFSKLCSVWLHGGTLYCDVYAVVSIILCFFVVNCWVAMDGLCRKIWFLDIKLSLIVLLVFNPQQQQSEQWLFLKIGIVLTASRWWFCRLQWTSSRFVRKEVVARRS